MARTPYGAVIPEPATVSFSESEYLTRPDAALAEASHGQRVEVLALDGSPRVVIYPGTIADVPSRE